MEATFGTTLIFTLLIVGTIIASPILAFIPWPWIDPEDAL
jgi:hypothetical protein